MKTEKEILLNHAWELFLNQGDFPSGPVIDAVIYFHRNHQFDLGVLPEEIQEIVLDKLYMEDREDYLIGDLEDSFNALMVNHS